MGVRGLEVKGLEDLVHLNKVLVGGFGARWEELKELEANGLVGRP